MVKLSSGFDQLAVPGHFESCFCLTEWGRMYVNRVHDRQRTVMH